MLLRSGLFAGKTVHMTLAAMCGLGCSAPGDGAVAPSPECGSSIMPSFTEHLLAPGQIKSILPLGNAGGGAEAGRAGLTIVNLAPVDGDAAVPLFAPVDAKLTEVTYAYNPFDPETAEWSITLSVSCEVEIKIDHVTEVVEAIRAVGPETPSSNTEPQPVAAVTFLAGDALGSTRGTSAAKNFNFAAFDRAVVNQFVNQDRYTRSLFENTLLHAVCPYDYFPEDAKSLYYEKLGDLNAAVPGTGCGEVSQDRVDTVQGLWFTSPNFADGMNVATLGDYASPLAILKHPDGSVALNTFGGREHRIAKDNPSHLDPAAVTTEHCYQLVDGEGTARGLVYLELQSSTELWVHYDAAALCGATDPGNAVVKYYR